jgi:putative ATP-binding cassette transporter
MENSESVLQQVNLQNIATKVHGFDAGVPWENILSLEENNNASLLHDC